MGNTDLGRHAQVTPDGFVIQPVEGGVEIVRRMPNCIGEVLEIPAQIGGQPVVSIGAMAFYRCENIRQVLLPEGLRRIGSLAFAWCGNLQELVLPQSVTEMGVNPFDACMEMKALHIPEGHPVLRYQDGLLTDERSGRLILCLPVLEREHLIVPEGVRVIGDRAFRNCWSIWQISLPDSAKTVGAEAFAHCNAMDEISLGGVTHLGWRAFEHCTVLKSVGMPAVLRGIGEGAFRCCAMLKTLDIPDSVTSIGQNAFEQCRQLTLMVGGDSAARKHAETNGLRFICRQPC